MVNIRIILVAIDFSDLSPTVLDYACSLAMAWKARLLVVHVVHDLSYFAGFTLRIHRCPNCSSALKRKPTNALRPSVRVS
mgnify:CR=1 FL=1